LTVWNSKEKGNKRFTVIGPLEAARQRYKRWLNLERNYTKKNRNKTNRIKMSKE
jgi:hypothetical protein